MMTSKVLVKSSNPTCKVGVDGQRLSIAKVAKCLSHVPIRYESSGDVTVVSSIFFKFSFSNSFFFSVGKAKKVEAIFFR